MPILQTRHFGALDYPEESVFDFPTGIPGFEEEKRFLFIEEPLTKPLVFLQSVTRAGVCLPALPVQFVHPGYRLHLSPEDLQLLDLPPDRSVEIGADTLCIALLSLADEGAPTVNLLAPVVVNLRKRRGVQAIQIDTDYSYRHALAPGTGGLPCS